jgi:hypothetical protein
MPVDRKLVRNVMLAVGLTFSSAGMAQPSTVNFQISFSGHVDCNRPFKINNVPISGEGTGTLRANGNVTADLTETAFILSTQIHFEGRLGRPTPAPGGTAQVRVAGRHRLLLIWNLPNNQMIVTVVVRGQSCTATFEPRLKRGKTEYTLFDGSIYHYCGRPTAERASCQVH